MGGLPPDVADSSVVSATMAGLPLIVPAELYSTAEWLELTSAKVVVPVMAWPRAISSVTGLDPLITMASSESKMIFTRFGIELNVALGLRDKM